MDGEDMDSRKVGMVRGRWTVKTWIVGGRGW